jgi:DNA adenine methylase
MAENEKLKAPFPYFGGKSRIAETVWALLGNPARYIEPFFGSGAVLLNRPEWEMAKSEIVNDKCGFISNAWRALKFSPDETAEWADWPVNHADLSARRIRLMAEEQNLLARLVENDEWHDSKMAGYWIWAASCWIGSGLTRIGAIPHLTSDQGVTQIPHLTDDRGVTQRENIRLWFTRLSDRLRNVKVVCGEWGRVCGGNWQGERGTCGIFFAPPYSAEAERDNALYAQESGTVAHDVRAWARKRGGDPRYRIVLAGYAGEHDSLEVDGWGVIEWSTAGGFGNQGGNQNRHRERLWYSPHCVAPKKEPVNMTLFGENG